MVRNAVTSILIFNLLILHTTADTPNLQPQKANCTGENYSEGSPFAANLASLLSSLTAISSSNISAIKSITTTAGNSSDAAYGVFMCQGHIPNSECNDCISAAATTINQSCPAARQAIIWYDTCQLRYSDFNFFGIPDTAGFSMSNFDERTSSSQPFSVVSDLVKTAPLQRPLMFAPKALISDSIYAAAQCTIDLSTNGCSTCLKTILADIEACCTQWQGWRYLATSCSVRYEQTPFLRNLNGTQTQVIRYNCSASTFPPNSLPQMESNLNNLLTNLTTKTQVSGFYNTTVGQSPDQLYGLALCRGDLPPQSGDCSTCLSNAMSKITGDCSNSTGGIEWYEKCLMRYSNQNFFGSVDLFGLTMCGVDKVSQAAGDATIKLASGLLGMAANNSLMVATGEQGVDSLSPSYILVQCTRDLTSESCKSCLEYGLSQVDTQCKLTNGWRYLSGSCTLRYEIMRFYSTITTESSGPPPPQEVRGKGKAQIAAIVTPILGAILLGSLLYYLWRKLRRKNAGRIQLGALSLLPDKELPHMDLAIIQMATSNFSDKNKLGEGGFGPVYKGILHGGQEIAIKRLSEKSKQGVVEFKNEVKLIAKLQHRNLVKMLGCCIEREEKLLVYEFLPNRSLDTFIFDSDRRAQLNWNRRVQIIAGIARGLLYLHEDSRLKVIHRDLKASNVLLDDEMNPKISDFGMAKIYGADESDADTNRIVGTYGYMAPEYAMEGQFSVKSDVYSFGVLLLEILYGEKNGRSGFENFGQTLLRHAWQLWNEGRPVALMDPLLEGSYPENEAIKCINIGLLCVQENLEKRPTMSLVVHMLRGDEMVIPQPTQPPTFFRRQNPSNLSSNTHSINTHSINEMTKSIIEPR